MLVLGVVRDATGDAEGPDDGGDREGLVVDSLAVVVGAPVVDDDALADAADAVDVDDLWHAAVVDANRAAACAACGRRTACGADMHAAEGVGRFAMGTRRKGGGGRVRRLVAASALADVG